jgi:hypothetical protein
MERFVLGPFEHGQVTETTEIAIAKLGRAWRIDRAQYINPTGLAEDATNFFTVQVLKEGTDVAASWSTETGEEGTLTAATWVELTLSGDAKQVFAADDEVSLNLEEAATATLPAGRLVLECRYI